MKKILIINPGYFGSYVDTIYHALYLKNNYSVTYFGINEKDDFYKMDGIDYVLINNSKYRLFSKLKFLICLYNVLQKNKYDLALMNYFMGCSITQLLSIRTPIILDIRTSFICKSNLKRFIFNLFLTFEAFFFNNITVISEGVRKYLKIKNSAHILPLGAFSNPFSEKSYEAINLLYVGTFKERNIHETIIGFSKFYLEYKAQINIKYTIIGSGTEEENNYIRNLIEELKLSNIVNYLGYINHNEIHQYFKQSNIGVSYIPITRFFNFQPPTKTFEYLMNGLIVIATKTSENCKAINNTNGILIKDNAESFYNALVNLNSNINKFAAKEIFESSQKYSWESIVSKNLTKYLEQIN